MATGERLIELFRQLDRNGNGVIEREELRRVLEALDEVTWTEQRLDAILREADATRAGTIQRPTGGVGGSWPWWWGGTGSSCAGSSRRARGRRRSAGRSRRHFEGCLGWPKTSSQDLSKGVRFQVEALVGLRELAALPEADRTAAESCSIGIRGSWIHFRSSLWLRSYRRRSYKISHDREKRPGSYT